MRILIANEYRANARERVKSKILRAALLVRGSEMRLRGTARQGD